MSNLNRKRGKSLEILKQLLKLAMHVSPGGKKSALNSSGFWNLKLCPISILQL